MRSLAKLVPLAVVAVLSVAGCSRNNIEAVNLSIEGDKAAKSNSYDEAISKYEQGVQLDPTNHRILYKLAMAYQKKELWDKVADTAKKAYKQAPKFASYHFLEGLAYARMAVKGPTAWSEAKGPLEETIQLDPNIADAHFELAEVLLHTDDEQGALRAYSKAIEAKPDNLAFYIPLADLYIRLGFLDQAEGVVREGLGFAKEGDKFLFGLHSLNGQVLEMRGKMDESLKAYEQARRSCNLCNEPGQPIAYFNLGAAYAQVSPPNKSEAMKNLQSFQKMICKGAAAQRYADQCAQAQQIAGKLGGTLQ